MNNRRNKKKINNKYLIESMPQYGLGSWLKENAGTVGSVVGAGIGTLIAPGIGTTIGATLGGQIGGAVQQDGVKDQQVAMVNRQNDITNATANFQQQQQLNPMYGANFAMGGNIGQPVTNSPVQESSKKLDGITMYNGGYTHEQSPINGTPVGKKGLVERSEVRFGNYIFSNKF